MIYGSHRVNIDLLAENRYRILTNGKHYRIEVYTLVWEKYGFLRLKSRQVWKWTILNRIVDNGDPYNYNEWWEPMNFETHSEAQEKIDAAIDSAKKEDVPTHDWKIVSE